MEQKKQNPKKTKKQNKSQSRSRSRSRESAARSKYREEKKTKMNKITEEDSEDDDFNFRTFSKLGAEAIKELSKIPGLKETQRLVDEDGITGVKLEPLNNAAFLTATKILDQDPVVLLTPNLMLTPDLRDHKFNVHQFYSTQTSTFLKANPAVVVPVINRPGNPVNLMIQFRSALVASLHEIERFQGNNNPQAFNSIPKGTELGEMIITYGGGRHQLILGPISYYR